MLRLPRTLSMVLRVGLVLVPLAISSATTACNDATGACCKICKEGKACGDTCIAKSSTCHVGKGCACDG